jgi:glycosyltransferase involved in cell wall biosynthesis
MSKKTKILYTIPNFITAGSQYVLLTIINTLDKNRFEIFIGVEEHPEMIPDVIPNDHKVQIDFNGRLIHDVLSFTRLLRRLKIDIVHSWDYKSHYIEALSCRFSRASYMYTKKNAAWSKRWFLKSLFSAHIAYDHPEMRSRFFNHFLFSKKVSFIAHGVDLNKFKPMESTRVQKDIFKLCCVGNIGLNKNQLFILEQLKDLPSSIHLYLYGNTVRDYLKQLENYIKKEGLTGRVHIHNFVANNELPQLLNNFDLFVLASKQEGLPVSVLEALACGIPVLCSDSGGGTRFIFAQGKGGYVFNLENPQGFKDALLKFYQDKNYFETKKGEAISLANTFDVLEEVKAYELLYQKL